ncbi:MAG: dihydropteroate synthase [Clostridiales bacterium]|nr:dihydropteroate synthase [Clostridiales bacterium]
MIVGGQSFKNRTYAMAIINLTPDSFWADSRADCDDILFHTERAVKEGAAIIDIGAQSTRPDYTEVSAEEEIARLEKPLAAIKREFDIPVSVDTYYSRVARAALDLGADMINDIWGLTHDKDMAKTVARAGASVCIMHNSPQKLVGDIFPQIENFLKNSVETALEAGIDKDKICLDGGIGFAKDKEQNLQLLNGYDRLAALGYPLLLGTSRKSLFGGTPEERLPATLASTRLAVRQKVLFVRVHDVAENVKAIKEAAWE